MHIAIVLGKKDVVIHIHTSLRKTSLPLKGRQLFTILYKRRGDSYLRYCIGEDEHVEDQDVFVDHEDIVNEFIDPDDV